MWPLRSKSSSDEVRAGIGEVYDRLWRYCLVLAGNKANADDLAQAACLKALEKAEKYEAGTQFDRWIFRLTQRLWIDEIRKQTVREGGGIVQIEEVELMDQGPNPEKALMTSEVVESVLQLPEAQRSTVLLVYVEGYSYRDAAMILDIPVGTVMSRLAVARSKLSNRFSVQERAM
ncbi:MAG: RNA polymerase sigma factor [Rhizobiaceae bacterium]|nr:RNA polymerase sigma factor [Rhizobiaceae bacterium]